MSYRIFTIKVIPGCCDVRCVPAPMEHVTDLVSNPKLFAEAVLADGAVVLELGVDEVPKLTHGENPMLLWDISGQCRGMTRVFGWLNAEGFAEYMGAQSVEEA
jgi:hypothetical protein